ncbi:MAG: nitrile hydratase subunit beta [Rhodospirillales bacterium]|jgi:nitrile hydratase|nr:nitrile hydratase subunit beta [Rhodospirillales bacterium]MDP6644194.1 nitrile hydratase subunit beta [Rhodospirillales bacterium]MDP6842034.1 nitrile hydratase subunit beta [Rhodospirillales bacterium]|tara:strand:- start:207 stop:521 length:315 start_codon:yes stop_codon:yes gene_type:complete
MNGVHDMGGMHGLGPIIRDENEPAFHEEWERRMLGIVRAMNVSQLMTLDEFRHAVERMDPVDYLQASYYEHWLDGAERLFVEKGLFTRDEFEARLAELSAKGAS